VDRAKGHVADSFALEPYRFDESTGVVVWRVFEAASGTRLLWLVGSKLKQLLAQLLVISSLTNKSSFIDDSIDVASAVLEVELRCWDDSFVGADPKEPIFYLILLDSGVHLHSSPNGARQFCQKLKSSYIVAFAKGDHFARGRGAADEERIAFDADIVEGFGKRRKGRGRGGDEEVVGSSDEEVALKSAIDGVDELDFDFGADANGGEAGEIDELFHRARSSSYRSGMRYSSALIGQS